MATTLAKGVDFGAGLSDAWSKVITFVPKLLGAIVILLVAYIVAKALYKLVDVVLERVGFDRAVERGGVRQALARSKYDASDIVAKIVYYAVILFGLQMAFGIFGSNPISRLIESVIAFLPKAIVAIVIIVVVAAIAKGVKDLLGNALGGLSYGNTLANIASIFILALGVIAALNQVGIATAVTTPVLITVLATIGGIAIVGVGGGLIRPMQSRWENWLNSAQRETNQMRGQRQAQRAQRGQGGRLDAGSQPYPDEPARAPLGDPAAQTQQFDNPGARRI